MTQNTEQTASWNPTMLLVLALRRAEFHFAISLIFLLLRFNPDKLS